MPEREEFFLFLVLLFNRITTIEEFSPQSWKREKKKSQKNLPTSRLNRFSTPKPNASELRGSL